MSTKEKPPKIHDDSDSEGEEEDEDIAVPKVDIDPSKLTPLSPEVISKQASSLIQTSPREPSLTIPRLLSIWVCTLAMVSIGEANVSCNSRHDRSCRSRKVNCRKSNIGRNDRAVQK